MKTWGSISSTLLAFFAFAWAQSIFAAPTDAGLFAYVSFEEEIAQKLLAAYQAETKEKVEFVRLSTGEATARLEAEKSNPQASLWLGGVGIGHAEAKEKGLTVPYAANAASKLPAKYRDKDSYWNGIYLGVLSFAVNKDLLKKKNLQAPTSWNDLLDPKWKGHIQLPNPGTSGTSYNLITALITKDGEDKAFNYMKELHKNVSQYTRSGAAPTKNVALGESLVGVGYSQDILRLIYESKAPVEIIYPKDGTGYEVAAASLIKGGKQHEQAKKLIEWVYGPTATKIFAEHYFIPLKKEGVTLKKEAALPSSLKLIDTPAEWAGKNKQRLVEAWNEKVNH